MFKALALHAGVVSASAVSIMLKHATFIRIPFKTPDLNCSLCTLEDVHISATQSILFFPPYTLIYVTYRYSESLAELQTQYVEVLQHWEKAGGEKSMISDIIKSE